MIARWGTKFIAAFMLGSFFYGLGWTWAPEISDLRYVGMGW